MPKPHINDKNKTQNATSSAGFLLSFPSTQEQEANKKESTIRGTAADILCAIWNAASAPKWYSLADSFIAYTLTLTHLESSRKNWAKKPNLTKQATVNPKKNQNKNKNSRLKKPFEKYFFIP
jgi:hypothetical protein